MVIANELLFQFSTYKIKFFNFTNGIYICVRWIECLCLLAWNFLKWRPEGISSVNLFHWLILGSSLKSCLLIGQTFQTFDRWSRIDRIYGSNQNILTECWLHNLHHWFPRSLLLRLGVCIGSPSMLIFFTPRVLLKNQCVPICLAISLIVRCNVGMLS